MPRQEVLDDSIFRRLPLFVTPRRTRVKRFAVIFLCCSKYSRAHARSNDPNVASSRKRKPQNGADETKRTKSHELLLSCSESDLTREAVDDLAAIASIDGLDEFDRFAAEQVRGTREAKDRRFLADMQETRFIG